MSDEEYVSKLEKQVDDLEDLLLAHEAALEKALVYARDRNEEIKKIADFFRTTVPIEQRLRKSLAFWNDNDIQSEAKFKAVPWDAITEAVSRLPSENEVREIEKKWLEIQNSYVAFEQLQVILTNMNKKLRGRSKEIVDSHLESITMRKEGRYPVLFGRLTDGE